MQITTYPSHNNVDPDDIAGKSAVIIDTFRATTTMIAALENGAKKIVPVLHKSSAFAMRAANPGALLGGERHTKIIEGFDLGNSPLEVCPQVIQDKMLIMSTSNGTKAVSVATKAAHLFLGSFTNGQAVANSLAQIGGDVVFVCAGTLGRLSMEDLLTAGMVLYHLKQQCDFLMCDTSRCALDLYVANKDDLDTYLRQTVHYGTMLANDLQQDIAFCLRQNSTQVVPVFDGQGFVLK